MRQLGKITKAVILKRTCVKENVAGFKFFETLQTELLRNTLLK